MIKRYVLAVLLCLAAAPASAQFLVAPASSTTGNCVKFGTDRFHPLDAGAPCGIDLTAIHVYTTQAESSLTNEVVPTANVRTLLGAADFAAFRSSLSLGTAALVNTGTSGATIPILNVANTFASGQVFTGLIYVNNTAGNNRGIQWRTAGVDRWAMFASAAAESGTNAGSNFSLNRYADDGSYIDTPLSMTRSTGVLLVTKPSFGNAELTLNVGEMGLTKATASASAPGAAGCKLAFRAGTSANTGKLVAYCGTSSTGVTIVDNIGGGLT